MDANKNKIAVLIAIKGILEDYDSICKKEERSGKLLFQANESVAIYEIKELIMDTIGKYACEKIVDEDITIDDIQLVEIDKVLYAMWQNLIDLQATIVAIMENPERFIGIKIYACQQQTLVEIKDKINNFFDPNRFVF